MIRNQACHTNDGRCCGGGGTHENVADDISSATQAEIDLERAAQHVCRCAITNRNSHGADRVAERHSRLCVHNLAGKGIGQTNHQRVPGTYAEHERHSQTDCGIPGNESNTRKENDFRPVQQKV